MVSIGIIGAGPAGIAAARVLIANDRSYDIDLFETSSKIGGVWNYDPQSNNTAMYDVLETNLSSHLMAFKDYPFTNIDPNIKTFPGREQVQQYLESYYDSTVANYSKLGLFTEKRVISLEKVDSHWELKADSDDSTYIYDYIVVANGHFNKLFIPTVPGSYQWKNQSHSKDFVNSEHYRGLNVVVVGNASSATDIATQISTTASKVYHSVKPDSETNWPANSIIEVVSQIQSLDEPNSNTVHFIDGTSIQNVDHIIWATGFQYGVPFLKSYHSDLFRNQSNRLYNLWEQIVYKPDPTIFFSLLPKNIIPFQLAELQASIIDLVILGSITKSDMVDADNESITSSDYHSLPTPKDIEYYQHLGSIVARHGPDSKFKPLTWTDSLVQERISSSKVKAERQKLLVQWAIHQNLQNKPYSIPPDDFTG